MERAPEYPIGVVSRLTGLSIETLRAWERRYGVVAPRRHGRARLYDDAAVAKLRLLRDLTAAGHSIGQLAALPANALAALRAGGAPPGGREGEPAAAAWDALLRFDAGALDVELARLAALLPPRALCEDVVLPLLRRAGAAWEAGRLSIAQEHLLSAALRTLLGTVLRTHAPAAPRARAVFAAPAGELHELGLLAAALLAAAAGVAPLFLGPNLPAADIARAARASGARAVVLAAVCGAADPIAAVAEVADALPPGIALLVGGVRDARLAAALGERATFVPDLPACAETLAALAP